LPVSTPSVHDKRRRGNYIRAFAFHPLGYILLKIDHFVSVNFYEYSLSPKFEKAIVLLQDGAFTIYLEEDKMAVTL